MVTTLALITTADPIVKKEIKTLHKKESKRFRGTLPQRDKGIPGKKQGDAYSYIN